jgi:hypothetical protein
MLGGESMNHTVNNHHYAFYDPDGTPELAAHIAKLREVSGMCLDQFSHCLCRLDNSHATEHWCPCGNRWNDEP